MAEDKRDRGRRPTILLLLGTLVVGGLGGIAFSGVSSQVIHATSQTEFCTSCHVYDNFAERFKQTVHQANASGVQAGCGDCHIPSDNIVSEIWHKTASGLSDGFAYYVMGVNTPREFRAKLPELREEAKAWFVATDSATCRSCHDPAAMEASAQSAAARGAHAALGTETAPTCVSCHSGIAHPGPDAAGAHGADDAESEQESPDREEAADPEVSAEPEREDEMETAEAETAETEAAETGDGETEAGETGTGETQMAQTQTASAEAGAQIASNVCAQCHKLPTGQGANVGPAFSEMAQQGPYQAADIARIMQQGQHAAARAQTEAADYPKLAEYLNSLR